MSETPHVMKETSADNAALNEDQTRRFTLFRIIAWISFAAFTTFLGGYLLAWLLMPDFPVLLIWVDVGAVLLTVVVGVLLRRDIFGAALHLYVSVVTLVLFAAIYFVNGVTSPIVLALPIIALIAGELGGRQIAYITAGAHIALYLLLWALEFFGLFQPFQMPDVVTRVIWVGIFVTATAVIVAVNQQFVAFMQTALAASAARERELTAANLRAQEAAAAESAAQAATVMTAQQIQDAVQVYSAFMARVTQGDYATSLDLDALAQSENLPAELLDLGQYLNTTVTTLVTALDEARLAQQRYLEQSWEAIAELRTIPTGYRLAGAVAEVDTGAQVEIAEDAWLEPMTEAVVERTPVVGEGELAVPIVSGAGAQLIGALGMRRPDAGAWTEDELAIITAITDQLAQTIENLRLIDETTRRAAREQTAGEITSRIREATEIESVLERALAELGHALAAERGSVHLALDARQEEGV